MADQVMEDLKRGIELLQNAYARTSAARQQIVITALTLRENGLLPDPGSLAVFERARGALMIAAQDFDNVMDAMREEDYEAWVRITKRMDQELRKVSSTNMSSTSVVEMINAAVPQIPRLLLSPTNTAEVGSAIASERATYNVKPGGLGFVPAVATITSACTAGITAGAVTGVGAVIVGVGCALLVAAAVVASLYIIYKVASQLPRLVQSFSPQAAASLAEAERLEAAAKVIKAGGDAKIDADTMAKIADNLSTQAKPDNIPWTLIFVIGAALLLYKNKSRVSEYGERAKDIILSPRQRALTS